MTHVRAYGWTPPPEGHRGVRARATVAELGGLPAHVELAHVPMPTDQGPLGSCTGHATALALAQRMGAQRLRTWLPSPLDLYLGGRAAKGSVDRDAGAILADVLYHAETQGFAPDLLWPHTEHHFDFRGPPPEALEAARPRTRLVTWEPLDWDLPTLRWELACGYPLVLGARVFPAFERVVGDEAAVPLPEGTSIGGHALCVIGYSDARGALLIQNSWGASWGSNGRAWIPYAYVLNPAWCGELHVVRVVRAS